MTPRDAVSAIANIEPAPLNFRDRRPHEDPDDYAVYSNGLLTTFYEDGCSLRDFKVYHRPPQVSQRRLSIRHVFCCLFFLLANSGPLYLTLASDCIACVAVTAEKSG
jgi:hypothetical protein